MHKNKKGLDGDFSVQSLFTNQKLNLSDLFW